MDPSAPLDYALFHLTPTRTRCDLLVFPRGSGGGGVKIASGLLDPFLSHLRCAREQISKGGYSITLRPPSSSSSSWFTKITLERFVRFVSTPEILERLASIEREIVQIESSIRLAPNPTESEQTDQGNMTAGDGNFKKPTVPSKLKVEPNGHDAAQGENSKLCLQRVLETRKAVLQKEQGMAYARAFVAGFELAHIEDLVSFANAFGASRLREACMNFKELCEKKEKDKLWMDELAAIKVCSQSELSYIGTSGIMLTTESIYNQNSIAMAHVENGQLELHATANDPANHSTTNSSSSNANQDNSLNTPRQEPLMTASGDIFHTKAQVPITQSSHPPQYTYSFQRPVTQQMPPYQGYTYPGMQFFSPYYSGHPGNMQWPPCSEESNQVISQDADHHQRNNKPPSSKVRSSNGKKHRSNQTTLGSQKDNSNQNSSDPGSDTDTSSRHDISSDREAPNAGGLQKRRSKKKSSRTVVIRNINYISSKRRDGGKDSSSGELSGEEDFIDGDFLKNEVENVVDSLQKHNKSTRRQSKKKADNMKPSNANEPISKACNDEKGDESWHAFGNILMRDEESGSNEHESENNRGINGIKQHLVEVGDEYCVIKSPELTRPSDQSCPLDAESAEGTKLWLVATDSVTINERDANKEDASHMEKFECDENYCRSMKRSYNNNEDLLFSQSTKPESDIRDALSDYTNEASVFKGQRGGDWFIVSQSEKLAEEKATAECSFFEGDQTLILANNQQSDTEKSKRKLLIDDSFVVPTRTTVNDQTMSQWETDMSIVSGVTFASASREADSTVHSKVRISCDYEPDDLQMVLERESRVELLGASWIPEIDYTTDITNNERNSGVETNGCNDDKMPPNCKDTESKNADTGTKHSNKDTKFKPLRGPLVKSKSDVLSRNRKPFAVSREVLPKSKREKEEENRKKMEALLVQRQKRIAQRSASSSTPATSKENSTEGKGATGSLNHDKKISRSAIQESNRSKLQKSNMATSTQDKNASGQSKQNGVSSVIRSTQPKGINIRRESAAVNSCPGKKNVLQTEPSSSSNQLSVPDQPSIHDSTEDTKQAFSSCHRSPTVYDSAVQNHNFQLQEPSPLEENKQGKVFHINSSNDESWNPDVVSFSDSSIGVQPAQLDNNGGLGEPQMVHEEKKHDFPALQANGFTTSADPAPSIPQNHEITINGEIQVEEEYGDSTSPPINSMNPEVSYSRKKWTSNGSPPPTAKGIKKLLLFGRRSSNSIAS